eukprot:12323731-Ditylum_brightwellii.AAC.1
MKISMECVHTFKVMKKGQKDIKSRHDYAVRLVAAFAQEIQSEHFGANTTLSMKCVSLECYPCICCE